MLDQIRITVFILTPLIFRYHLPFRSPGICFRFTYKVNIVILSPLGAQFMGFSPDNKMILFSYDIKPVWRHSYTAQYLVLDTVANKANTNILYQQIKHTVAILCLCTVYFMSNLFSQDKKFVIMCYEI
jgi:hypothetical protein